MIKSIKQQSLKTNHWHQQTVQIKSDNVIASLLEKLEKPVFFDSGNKHNASNTYHIISGDPIDTINSGNKTKLSRLQSHLDKLPQAPNHIRELPFTTGLLGFVSYDFGERLLLDENISNDPDIPSIYTGLYTWSLVKEISKNTYYLTFSTLCTESARNRILNLIKQAIEDSDNHVSVDTSTVKWTKTSDQKTYNDNLGRIRSYINNGDCYQVNYAQKFVATTSLPPTSYYFALRQRTQTPYSCFMQLSSNCYLLSFSPEQFIGINERRIETKPIKGTIENNDLIDNQQKLMESNKDRAENLMIVDLLRNDLSKVCQLHSVKVDKLFALESFNNVHHLVSHISGTLNTDVSELEAFFECFPGGSITGAPKKRAMEIIRELEGSPRGPYCGSVFYLNHNGKFDSNILIRTITQSGDKLQCWGGGGITADSDIESEYKESLIKVSNLTGIAE